MAGKRHTIVFVHGSLVLGGAEVLRLSVLDELRRRGEVDCRICVLRDDGELAEKVVQRGVPIDILGSKPGLLNVASIFRLTRYLRRHRPTIVQSSQFVTNTHTRIAGWLARTPVVIIEEHGIYTWKRWRHRFIDRWINRFADAVVACSHGVAESAARHLSIETKRITVIHNCASQEHVDSPTHAVDSQTPPPSPRRFVISIIGTLRWEKGHQYLIECWKKLNDANRLPSGAVLQIIGTGPLESELRSQADSCDSIRFLGSRSDTVSLLRQSDLFVLPSINEGFGIAIVEAMFAGVPVVATRSGGIPEVIVHEKTGFLVEPRNTEQLALAIEKLSRDADLRREISAAARADAMQRFTPSVYVDQLQSLYDRLTQRMVEKIS